LIVYFLFDDTMERTVSTKLGSDNNIIITDIGSKFFYIPITKNASSYTYSFFKQIKWLYYRLNTFSEVETRIPIVVLRNPLERWCSGFSQDCFFDNLRFNLDDDNVLDSIFNTCHTGIHTLPQCYFLKNFDLSNAIFLDADKNLIKNLEDLTKNIIQIGNFINLRNHPSKSKMNYGIKDQIKKVLENPKYSNKLNEYLAEDWKLYDNCSFYKG